MYDIPTPGRKPCRLYCERLAIDGGTVNMTTDPPQITSDVVGVSGDEDSIALNASPIRYMGRNYSAGQVILFELVAAAGITETEGEVRIAWQSADGTIKDRRGVPLEIDDWLLACGSAAGLCCS